MASVTLISLSDDCNIKSPSINRKIVPEPYDNAPSYAWSEQTIDEFGQKEEKKGCFGSLNIIDKLTDDNKKCKYVELSKKEGEILIPHSIVPHLDDRLIAKEIIRVVRSKKRKKNKTLSKFFCPPYFILLLSIIEIIIYALNEDKIYYLLLFCPHQGYQMWRFISYMLLHSGIIHLTLNIIIQMLLATPLEWEQGWWRCAIVYLGGGVIGGIGASILQPSLCMVGSSAGVYALLISHVANVILRYNTIKYKGYRLFAVAVLAMSDIVFSIAQSYADIDNLPKIGWAAHCAGGFAGIAIGLLVFKGGDKRNIYTRLSIWISAFSLTSFIVGGVLYNLFFIIG